MKLQYNPPLAPSRPDFFNSLSQNRTRLLTSFHPSVLTSYRPVETHWPSGNARAGRSLWKHRPRPVGELSLPVAEGRKRLPEHRLAVAGVNENIRDPFSARVAIASLPGDDLFQQFLDRGNPARRSAGP